MKRQFALTLAAAALMGLSACITTADGTQYGSKQTVGAGAGAILGGIAGSNIGDGSGQLWATGAGALIGALVGSEVGKSLDRADRMYLQNANQQAQTAPIGETITWSNPESGNYGAVTPVRDGRTGSGRYCREYEQVIYIGGEKKTGIGQACQVPGTDDWEIVK